MTPSWGSSPAGLTNPGKFIGNVEMWGCATAEHVICCTEFMRKELMERYGAPPDRTSVVPCGVDEETFRVDHIEHMDAFRSVVAEPDERVVLYVGRLDPEKGIETLLEAIPKVLEAEPRAKFVLAGTGRLEEQAQGDGPEAGHGLESPVPWLRGARAPLLPLQVRRRAGLPEPLRAVRDRSAGERARIGAALLSASETSLACADEIVFNERLEVAAAVTPAKADRPLWRMLAFLGFAVLLIQWWYLPGSRDGMAPRSPRKDERDERMRRHRIIGAGCWAAGAKGGETEDIPELPRNRRAQVRAAGPLSLRRPPCPLDTHR